MSKNRIFVFSFTATLLVFTLIILSIFTITPAQAQALDQDVDNGTCINCHEDLYFNHDTGHWFCLRESPMTCVSCHGGDPTATTKEKAHYDRSAHPVVNEDISVCQRCHADECFDRVSEFDQVAGIKAVKLAAPIAISKDLHQPLDLPTAEQSKPVNWLLLLDVLAVFAVISLALAFYAAKKARQP